jgi:hypothetical protein
MVRLMAVAGQEGQNGQIEGGQQDRRVRMARLKAVVGQLGQKGQIENR